MKQDFLGQIVDTIVDSLHVRVTCPYCGGDIDLDALLNMKVEGKEWRKLAIVIAEIVKEEIADRAGEAIGKIKL